MSSLSWPPLAKTDSGELVTARQAKLINGPFNILGVEVIPCAGQVVRPYWRTISSSEYSSLREGFEMSDWHYDKQLEAHELGLEIEKQLTLENGRVVFADAYDSKTNTVIEYVWSCFDMSKIADYFLSGYNQEWIFAKASVEYAVASCCAWTDSYKVTAQRELGLDLPTIRTKVQE